MAFPRRSRLLNTSDAGRAPIAATTGMAARSLPVRVVPTHLAVASKWAPRSRRSRTKAIRSAVGPHRLRPRLLRTAGVLA
eukprot:12075287-Alexandrium_andersonii.AAC.1